MTNQLPAKAPRLAAHVPCNAGVAGTSSFPELELGSECQYSVTVGVDASGLLGYGRLWTIMGTFCRTFYRPRRAYRDWRDAKALSIFWQGC